MKCSDIQKLIPAFLDDDLDNQDLSLFLSHVESCSECREELTIQFLVSVGLDNLRSDSRRKLGARKYLVFISYVLEIAVAALFALCLLLLIAL